MRLKKQTMESKDWMDFTKGETAVFLSKKRGIEFEHFEPQEFSFQNSIPMDAPQIMKEESGYHVWDNGEEQRLLFYYKRNRYSAESDWPRYHIVRCKTMNKYPGWVAATQMPVLIRDTNGVDRGKHLRLCIHCKRQVFRRNMLQFMFGSQSTEWYDAVLQFFSDRSSSRQLYQSNGYHMAWSQLSYAYRESVSWRCENEDCRVNLSAQDERRFLHTHHTNHDKKDNRRANFKALCLLCHGLEHPEKLENGTGFYDIDSFVDRFAKRLSQQKLRAYREIKSRFQ